MVSMGKREANVRKLKNIRLSALKDNKERIDVVINLYESGKVPNYLTAENLVERLANKTKRKDYTNKTDKEFNKLVGKYSSSDSVKGILARTSEKKKVRNVMVTVILFREKESEKAEKQREAKGAEVPVNIDFDKGTTVPEANAIKKKVRAAGAKVTDAAQDEIVKTGRGRNAKTEVRHSKLRHVKDLRQFYIGEFELRLDGADLSWQKNDVEDSMLIRKEPEASEGFRKACKLLRAHNVVFAHLMDSTGDSYLAGLYMMKISDTDSTNTAFEPKKAKNKDTDKMAAFYRFTTTEVDLEASTFKQAISNQKYAKDECFLNSIYDFYRENLLKADGKRNAITRESMLKTISKTEQNVKDGLSIEDMLPFFVKHRLVLRVFDKLCKVIFKYDPPSRSHHNKAMYCMISDGHV